MYRQSPLARALIFATICVAGKFLLHMYIRGNTVRNSTYKGIISTAFAALALSGAAWAEENHSCSDATLYGEYAFTVAGQIFLPSGASILRQGVALTHFDGAGHLTQVDEVLSSPNATAVPGAPVDPATGFHDQETGMYTVHSDCTGTFSVQFPPNVSSTGTVSGAKLTVRFVLSNHGRDIDAIVTSITPPGAPGPVPALIHSEGHKLGLVESERY
jgi:hypothetical protein